MALVSIYSYTVGSRMAVVSSFSRNLALPLVRYKSTRVPPVPSGSRAASYSEPMVSLQDSASVQPVSYESYRSGDHEFSVQRPHDIINRADNGELSEGQQAVNGEEEQAEVFNHTSNVSLHSVMQSNVPEPYQNEGKPSHRNMPQGGQQQRQKYLYDSLQYTHPSRNFSTYRSLLMQGAQETNPARIQSDESPQGIQGDDCINFKLWLENCNKYHFSDCEQQLKDFDSGRRSLRDIFQEQDSLIRKIAEDFQKSEKQGSEIEIMQQLQGEGTYVTSNTDQARKDQVCPQGVQGHECDNFKLWMRNCIEYGFADCQDQLDNFKSGRKTLSSIFEEQDRLIRGIAEDYKKKPGKVIPGVRYYSTNTEASDKNSSQSGVKLSQRDKLKRAVKEYGSTVVVFHVTMSLTMLGAFYVAVSSGLDVVGMLRSIGVGEQVLGSRIATGASTFVVAYASYKVFAPLRIAITLSVTPFIVRYLRRIGFLKPPKSSV